MLDPVHGVYENAAPIGSNAYSPSPQDADTKKQEAKKRRQFPFFKKEKALDVSMLEAFS